MNDEQMRQMAQAAVAVTAGQNSAKLALAETHMSAAASLSNKATIMAIVSAVLAIVVAVGFKVNSTVILSAAGLIVSGVLALVHAAQTHTLFAAQLMTSNDLAQGMSQLSAVMATGRTAEAKPATEGAQEGSAS